MVIINGTKCIYIYNIYYVTCGTSSIAHGSRSVYSTVPVCCWSRHSFPPGHGSRFNVIHGPNVDTFAHQTLRTWCKIVTRNQENPTFGTRKQKKTFFKQIYLYNTHVVNSHIQVLQDSTGSVCLNEVTKSPASFPITNSTPCTTVFSPLRLLSWVETAIGPCRTWSTWSNVLLVFQRKCTLVDSCE